MTVSRDGVQVPFDMVHTSLFSPAFNPLTTAEARLALLKVPPKFTIDQVPVPEVGLLAAKV